MAELKIKTGDETIVPGKDEAARQKKKAAAEAEKQSTSLFSGAAPKDAGLGPDYGDQRIRFHKRDEINPYADAEDERHSMDKRLRTILIMIVVLLLVMLFVSIFPTEIFSVERADSTIGTLASEMGMAFQGLLSTLMGQESMYSSYVLTIVVTVIAGAALGVSGGVYQGALKNALASPSTLGVTSGGTLGMIIFVIFVYPHTITNFSGSISDFSEATSQLDTFGYIAEYYGTFLCSLIGCIVVVALVMAMALIAGRGKLSNASLVIAGQVFTAVIGVVITWIRLYLTTFGTEDQIALLLQSQSVSFNGLYTGPLVLAFAIPIAICIIIIFCMSSRLSLLAFNDEEARSMGISTTRTRNLMVAVCTIMTALVISFCGPVGFVGFMVPHIARNMIGPDFRYLLPACAVIGAILVCGVYFFTELGIPGLPSGSTGTFTSIVGCIMFLVMALRQRGSSNGQWF